MAALKDPPDDVGYKILIHGCRADMPYEGRQNKNGKRGMEKLSTPLFFCFSDGFAYP